MCFLCRLCWGWPLEYLFIATNWCLLSNLCVGVGWISIDLAWRIFELHWSDHGKGVLGNKNLPWTQEWELRSRNHWTFQASQPDIENSYMIFWQRHWYLAIVECMKEVSWLAEAGPARLRCAVGRLTCADIGGKHGHHRGALPGTPAQVHQV